MKTPKTLMYAQTSTVSVYTKIVLSACALSFAMACSQAQELRRTTTINKTSTVQQVEQALFPKDLMKQKEECAKLEKAGFRCQSVLPKSSLETVLITFSRGSDKISEEGKGILRQIGEVLQKNKTAYKELVIEGHTDVTGSDSLNQALSKNRAAAVRDFLEKEYGVTNVSVVGRASEFLKDPSNPTSQENRRVEFVLDW